VVTTLSEILARSGAASAPSRAPSSGKKGRNDDMDFDDDENHRASYDALHGQLLRLCTRDGTPEQARNSVYAISSMIRRSPPQSPPSSGGPAGRAREERKEFEPLLRALANPSRLRVPDDHDVDADGGGGIVSVLSAVAAVAECAPYAFNAEGAGGKKGWGRRALDFCLDTALLGRNGRLAAEDSSDGESTGARKGGGGRGANKRSRSKKTDDEVSVRCRMLCGAIEVLVSHIRSTIANGKLGSESGAQSERDELEPPPSEHVSRVFDTLVKIIEDGGAMPPSNERTSPRDEAELRRASAVGLLRLCDPNLRLEPSHLSPRAWHVLASSLLDSDASSRAAILSELSAMYSCAGRFRAPPGRAPLAPSLRMASLAALCADPAGDDRIANGGAANAGARSTDGVRLAATNLTRMLRATCQHVAARCRSEGRGAERNFEARLKMKLMPEYCVPYALHLLAFRHETASAAGMLPGERDSDAEEEDVEGDDDEEEELAHSREASQKMLKKRLKGLFDPLIESLGAGADNISFLLRMVELIGKHPPINVLKKPSANDMSSLDLSLDDNDDEDDSDVANSWNDVDEKEAAARMKIICQFAREVLLSHVKKDVNLTVYPGSIQIPGDLYARRTSVSPVPRYEDSDESEDERKDGKRGRGRRKPKKSISHYVKKGKDAEDMEDEDGSVQGSKSEESAGSEEKTVDRRNSSATRKKEGSADTPGSGDTYEHSPPSPPAASPPADFDGGFGEFSPIAKVDDSSASDADRSPVATGAPKGRGKKRPSSSKNVRGARSKTPLHSGTKKRPTTSAAQEARTKTPSDGGRGKKRGANEIEVFVDSPMTDGDVSPPKRPRGSGGRGVKKSSNKATPVTVPKSVMVNVTNSASSRSAISGVAAQKKRTTASSSRKKTQKKKAAEEEMDDDLDFSDESSPAVPKKGKAKSASGGKKAAPARKARAPTKAKVSAGKAKVSAGKARSSAGGKTEVARKSKASASGKAEAAARKLGGKKPAGKAATASPSTTSEASSRPSPVRRGARRSARA